MNSNLKPLSYSDETDQQVETPGSESGSELGSEQGKFTPLSVAGTQAPGKYVIGADTYRAWFSQLSSSLPLTLAEENTQTLQNYCRDLQEQLRKMPMPKAIDINLRRELFALCQRGPVSVRSSATLDDGQGETSTATQDAYLGVVGVDAVIARIIDCFVSMWDDKAVKLWSDRGIDPANICMTVTVK